MFAWAFFCLVLGWFCFKEQTCSMTSAMTSHWALSVQFQLRADLHHKNPINWAPPLQSHRNPVAAGRGTESSQVSWEAQHTKVPLDPALCCYLCINRAGQQPPAYSTGNKRAPRNRRKRINKIRNKKAVLMCKSSGAFQ